MNLDSNEGLPMNDVQYLDINCRRWVPTDKSDKQFAEKVFALEPSASGDLCLETNFSPDQVPLCARSLAKIGSAEADRLAKCVEDWARKLGFKEVVKTD